MKTANAVPHRVLGEKGNCLSYDIRLVCKKKEIFRVEDEIRDVCCDGEAVRELLTLMKRERVSQCHFREIVGEFCRNGYSVRIKRE